MIITKSKKPIAMITAFALLACMVLSINLLTVKAAGTVTTGSYTITPSSVSNADPDIYDNSQKVTIAVKFSAAVTVSSGAEADFNVVLNGTTLTNDTFSDPILYRVVSGASSNIVNIELYSNADINSYPGSSMTGDFFALRKAQCSITPASGSTLSHIKDAANDPATWAVNMTGLTLHTGYELHQTASVAATGSTPASVSYNTGSLAQVRGITWLRLLKNGVEVPFSTTDATAYPILTVSGTNHYFALHCHDFQNGDNNYYLSRINNNMNTNYTGFTTNYSISLTSGVLTIQQKPGTYTSGDTLSLEIYYSPDIP